MLNSLHYYIYFFYTNISKHRQFQCNSYATKNKNHYYSHTNLQR